MTLLVAKKNTRRAKKGLLAIGHSTLVAACVFVLGSMVPLISNLHNLSKYYAVLVPDYAAIMGPITTTRSFLPREHRNNPVDPMFQQYKQWHSQETLQKEFETLQGHLSPERKFGIAYYACPVQAGNRMGHFVEAMFWSMITNGTLLWKYYDRSDCEFLHQHLKRPPVRYCRSISPKEDCDKVLRRADFLPSFLEWKQRLGDLLPNATWLPDWTIFPSLRQDSEQNITIDNINDTVVAYPQVFFDTMYKLQQQQELQLHRLLLLEEAKERARQLLSVPPGYLCGFLLFTAFHIHPQFTVFPRLPSTNNGIRLSPLPSNDSLPDTLEHWTPEPTRQGTTVIVHSRHIHETNDGSNIAYEKQCLGRALRTLLHNSTNQHCQVILLSDRDATLNRTRQYIHESFPMCDAYSAPHEMKRSFLKEHGPFAGGGFYQDLSLVANQIRFVPTTETVFVGADRSSNRLVEATIWNELYQQDQYQGDDNMPQLRRCLLQGSTDKEP